MLNYFFKLIYKSKIDAFWLAEDIKEVMPEAECIFLDNDFHYLKISCNSILRLSEFEWLFTFYHLKYENIWNSTDAY